MNERGEVGAEKVFPFAGEQQKLLVWLMTPPMKVGLEKANESLLADLLSEDGAPDRGKELDSDPSYRFRALSFDLLGVGSTLSEIRQGTTLYPWRGAIRRATHLQWMHELFADQVYFGHERIRRWCRFIASFAPPGDVTLSKKVSRTLNSFPNGLEELTRLRGERVHVRNRKDPLVQQVGLEASVRLARTLSMSDDNNVYFRDRRRVLISRMDDLIVIWNKHVAFVVEDWSPLWSQLLDRFSYDHS
jgi:hypothetical protein